MWRVSSRAQLQKTRHTGAPRSDFQTRVQPRVSLLETVNTLQRLDRDASSLPTRLLVSPRLVQRSVAVMEGIVSGA